MSIDKYGYLNLSRGMYVSAFLVRIPSIAFYALQYSVIDHADFDDRIQDLIEEGAI